MTKHIELVKTGGVEPVADNVTEIALDLTKDNPRNIKNKDALNLIKEELLASSISNRKQILDQTTEVDLNLIKQETSISDSDETNLNTCIDRPSWVQSKEAVLDSTNVEANLGKIDDVDLDLVKKEPNENKETVLDLVQEESVTLKTEEVHLDMVKHEIEEDSKEMVDFKVDAVYDENSMEGASAGHFGILPDTSQQPVQMIPKVDYQHPSSGIVYVTCTPPDQPPTKCVRKKIPQPPPSEHLENLPYKIYRCRFCPKTFGTAQMYNLHERCHTGTQCNECSRMFSPFYYQKHTRKRVCAICSETFDRQCSFLLHRKTHQCQECSKVFHCQLGSDEFETHNRSTKCGFCLLEFPKLCLYQQHTKPVQCNACSATLPGRCNYEQHKECCRLRKVTGDSSQTLYKCGICLETFTRKSKFHIHSRAHQNQCLLCPKRFSDVAALSRHMHNKHRIKRKKINYSEEIADTEDITATSIAPGLTEEIADTENITATSIAPGLTESHDK